MMRLRIVLVVTVLLFAVAVQAQQTVTNATAQEIYELVHEQGGQVTFIDVRTPEEYDEGHIKGAVLLPVIDSDFPQKVGELPKDKTYVVYCRTGNRSQYAKKIMVAAGLSVIHMDGGIVAWKRAGYPVVK